MIRKKKGQNFIDEGESGLNSQEVPKKHFFGRKKKESKMRASNLDENIEKTGKKRHFFGRKKKEKEAEEFNLYAEDMEYIKDTDEEVWMTPSDPSASHLEEDWEETWEKPWEKPSEEEAEADQEEQTADRETEELPDLEEIWEKTFEEEAETDQEEQTADKGPEELPDLEETWEKPSEEETEADTDKEDQAADRGLEEISADKGESELETQEEPAMTKEDDSDKHHRIPKQKRVHRSAMRREYDPDNPDYIDDSKAKKKARKKMFLFLGAAAILIIGIGYFMAQNIRGGDEGKAYVESVRVITGLGSANGMNNRYTGEVEAQDSWKITLQSDMSVAQCYVSVGDQVQTGDKLFDYNTEELKLSQDKKELEVETMQNEITQLNKDIASYQEDLKTANASEKIELQTQILTAQTTIKKDEYSIKSGKEEIETIKKNITDATVTSKMNGVVKSINTSLGTSSGLDEDGEISDGTEDSAYMTILAVGDYRVKGTISETNVWTINEGDPVIVRSRVDAEKTWSGTINKINTDGTASETDSSSMNDMGYDDYSMDDGSTVSDSKYSFYVALDDDTDLMMGQHVFIEMDNGQDTQKDGIWIPSAYIKIDGENYYIWAATKRERLELRKITVGEYDEELDEYEVLKGLETSDYIACDNGSLKENMKTTKVESEAGSTGEYYEEETSDDLTYYDEEDYYDEGADYEEEDYYDESVDESYDDMGSTESIDEGTDGETGVSDSDFSDF